MTRTLTALLVGALFVLAGCKGDAEATEHHAAHAAEPIGHAECAACGMVVGEQPAPRAQAVHRDGTREYFCAIGDLLVYLQAPSPHGDVTDVFLEVVEPDLDPAGRSADERPWRRPDEVSLVVGVPREGVMGRPVLVYPDQQSASAAAERHGGEVVDWVGLRGSDEP